MSTAQVESALVEHKNVAEAAVVASAAPAARLGVLRLARPQGVAEAVRLALQLA